MRSATTGSLFATTVLVALLVLAPAISVQAAGWSERLEAVPWMALGGVLVGLTLGLSRLRWPASHLLGLATGLALITVIYGSFVPNAPMVDRVGRFVVRVADWLAAAFSGAPGTDNLLFAYTMALVAWAIGYAGS